MIIYGGYHHINKIGEFLQFSSKRKGIRAWNFRMMIRKIWQFLWYQNRNNFEKNEKRKDQAPLSSAYLRSSGCPVMAPELAERVGIEAVRISLKYPT